MVESRPIFYPNVRSIGMYLDWKLKYETPSDSLFNYLHYESHYFGACVDFICNYIKEGYDFFQRSIFQECFYIIIMPDYNTIFMDPFLSLCLKQSNNLPDEEYTRVDVFCQPETIVISRTSCPVW